MKGGDTVEIIAEWKRLADQEPDLEKRRLYGGLVLVFAELVDRRPMWKKELEGWNVKRSQTVMEWEAEAELRATRRNLLRVLKAHLQQEVPPSLVQIIEAQENLAVLETWLEKAVTVSSFDEMNAVLRQIGP